MYILYTSSLIKKRVRVGPPGPPRRNRPFLPGPNPGPVRTIPACCSDERWLGKTMPRRMPTLDLQLIPTALIIDLVAISQSDGHDRLWLIDELVPGNRPVVIFRRGSRPILCQILDRVQLGGARGQQDVVRFFGTLSFLLCQPARSIRTTPWALVATLPRCICIARVLAKGSMRAAPLPDLGQMAPNR